MQGAQQHRVQRSALGGQQRGVQGLIRQGHPAGIVQELLGGGPAGSAGRGKHVGQEDGERALARPVRSDQAPGPLTLRPFQTVRDLRQCPVRGRREHVPVQGVLRARIALQVDRALKTMPHADQLRERRRMRGHAPVP